MTMMRWMRGGVWMLAGLALAAGCNSPTDIWGTHRAVLERHRSMWEAAGIIDYRYVYSKSCVCPAAHLEPVLITVGAGDIVAVEYVADGVPVPDTEWHAYHTIDALFDLVATAIDGAAHELEITYDRDLGYPAVVDVDLDRNADTDDIRVEIHDLEAL